MSADTVEEQEKELAEMKEQIIQATEAEKEKAGEVPHPEPPAEVQENHKPLETPKETPQESSVESKPKGDDDPMKWAESKGYKTSEDMARALLKKEQEFHASRQKKEDERHQPDWQPRPDMGYQEQPRYPSPQPYQPYPPVYQRPDAVRQIASMYPQLDPQDTERILPVIFDVARVVSKQERDNYEKELSEIRRSTQRNNELMSLMQDPAFHDKRVQKEAHAILDADPTIFQREQKPLVYAFEKALGNLARKTLQQGFVPEAKEPNPPTTAGGGNGSAFTVPRQVTEREFDSWSLAEQKAYINSNGRILPKK